MYSGKKVAAIVTAAGSGRRMGAKTGKLFLKVGGKTVLERTVETVASSSEVDEIVSLYAGKTRRTCLPPSQVIRRFDGCTAGSEGKIRCTPD